MIKKISIFLAGLIILLLMSPMFVYWWALSNVENVPVPSKIELTDIQERAIWTEQKEAGDPRLKKVTPYGYILNFYCQIERGLYSPECMSKYPGLRVSALAVRNQVNEQIKNRGNLSWQVTWVAYTIWATQNWTVHQVLSTYYESFNT